MYFVSLDKPYKYILRLNNDLIVQNTQQLNNVMFDLDASLCQQTCNYNCVPNTTKLVTDYLTSCPTNELIYVL